MTIINRIICLSELIVEKYDATAINFVNLLWIYECPVSVMQTFDILDQYDFFACSLMEDEKERQLRHKGNNTLVRTQKAHCTGEFVIVA